MADSTLRLQLLDRRGRLGAVRLQQDVGLPEPLEFVRTGGTWLLELPRPDVERMEYLLEITDQNGRRCTILDPANRRRVGGAFGDKSVLEFPGYVAPAWLATDPVPAQQWALEVPSVALADTLSVTVWSPAGLGDAPAPLLVVHDGPEYASLGGLTHYLGAMIRTGRLPPTRAALIDPGDRNQWYAANPAYAAALCQDALAVLPAATVRVGVGASLGALAMLHAHRTHPGRFQGLLLQSGSFFTAELDPQEAHFSGFAAVSAFVASVAAAADDPAPVPTILSCGTVEENLANNRAMAGQLRRLGYPTELVVVRDAHNYTAWRDVLDPHLTRLVSEVVDAA